MSDRRAGGGGAPSTSRGDGRPRSAPPRERVTIAEAPGGVVLVAALAAAPTPGRRRRPPSRSWSREPSVRGAMLRRRGARVGRRRPDGPGGARARPRARSARGRVHAGEPRRRIGSSWRPSSSSAGFPAGARGARPLLRRRQLRPAARPPRRAPARHRARRRRRRGGAANAARLGLDARFVAADVAAALAARDSRTRRRRCTDRGRRARPAARRRGRRAAGAGRARAPTHRLRLVRSGDARAATRARSRATAMRSARRSRSISSRKRFTSKTVALVRVDLKTAPSYRPALDAEAH